MGYLAFMEEFVKGRLMDLHCGYIGKVVWTDGKTATVQPLGLVKEINSDAKAQAVVSDVPVCCKYKLSAKTIKDGNGNSQTVAVPTLIAKGDLVACLCADRDITAARRGKNEQPPAGHHSISDSIIVGIL